MNAVTSVFGHQTVCLGIPKGSFATRATAFYETILSLLTVSSVSQVRNTLVRYTWEKKANFRTL